MLGGFWHVYLLWIYAIRAAIEEGKGFGLDTFFHSLSSFFATVFDGLDG